MIKDIPEIQAKLIEILKGHLGSLKVRIDNEKNFEVAGTIETMQGKKKVDGFYFSNIMPKAKDVRFYFFPAYTHPDAYEDLSDQMKKFKKGKSCFHIKYIDEQIETELKQMVSTGIELYQKDGLI